MTNYIKIDQNLGLTDAFPCTFYMLKFTRWRKQPPFFLNIFYIYQSTLLPLTPIYNYKKTTLLHTLSINYIYIYIYYVGGDAECESNYVLKYFLFILNNIFYFLFKNILNKIFLFLKFILT